VEDGVFASGRPMMSSRLEDLRAVIGSDLERSTLSGNRVGNVVDDRGRSGSIIELVAPGDRTPACSPSPS